MISKETRELGAKIAERYWREAPCPKTGNKRDMIARPDLMERAMTQGQIDLLLLYFQEMDEDSKQRARLTLRELQAKLQ